MLPYSTCMYSEYRRTSGTETGTTTAERTLARAPFALPARGTMRTSRLRETKSACRSPSAWPARIPSPRVPSLLHDVALFGHLTGFCGASPGVWRSWLVDVHAAQHEIGGSQDAGVPGGVAVRREVLDGAR